jgi:predicted nicotinamide N-methyase
MGSIRVDLSQRSYAGGVRAGEANGDLVEEVVPLDGGELRVLRPRDSEELLDEEAFDHEEFLPYWAELWPSGVALARDVSSRSLRGARTLELGCGLALPSIAAALAGGRVLATDWSTAAIELARHNAERSGAAIETLVCDWARPEELLERGPWDLVLASDVLYERRNAHALARLLPRLAGPRSEILLADPGRVPAEAFLAEADTRFERRTTRHDRVSIHRLRPR